MPFRLNQCGLGRYLSKLTFETAGRLRPPVPGAGVSYQHASSRANQLIADSLSTRSTGAAVQDHWARGGHEWPRRACGLAIGAAVRGA